MEGYLLDNNVISILMRPKDPRYPRVKARFDGLGASPVYLPVIAIAEIEYGMAKAESPDERQRDAVRRFFEEYPIHLGVDDNTVEPYALIRSQLWKDCATKLGGKHKEKLPEELIHRESGKLLGIDERDLLIASVAAQYNLVLATCDRNQGMTAIEAAAIGLQRTGHAVQLRISYWRT
ncbi:MAG: type II toxin-antitoxin system VapC family toxin [Sedimentisphaerales bacterium]|nr:type II toxin-antitoxin system VapC family toxin [Sedimentisphaerales bacterium]